MLIKTVQACEDEGGSCDSWLWKLTWRVLVITVVGVIPAVVGGDGN